MSANIQFILFLSLLIAMSLMLLAFPFYPAWREWHHPTDDGALVVVASQTRNIIQVAHHLREKMLSERSMPVLASRAISAFGALEQKRPIYTTGSLKLRDGGKLSEVFTEGSLDLGVRSRITGWAHSEDSLKLDEGAVAVRQVSSASVIYIARKCCFEKLYAPVIYFGDIAIGSGLGSGSGAHKNTLLLQSFSMKHVVGATPWGPSGWRVSGDCEIPEASIFKGSLVVTGFLSIGAGAQVEGDLKAYKGIFIGENAQICGAIFCDGGIHISRGSNVAGPVVADTHLLIEFNSVLGSATAPTTISASSMLVGNGVVAYGTVWARQAGVVWGQA